MTVSNPQVQCPFCLTINLVRQEQPLCIGCGLELTRLLNPPAVPVVLPEPVPRKKRWHRRWRKARVYPQEQQVQQVPVHELIPAPQQVQIDDLFKPALQDVQVSPTLQPQPSQVQQVQVVSVREPVVLPVPGDVQTKPVAPPAQTVQTAQTATPRPVPFLPVPDDDEDRTILVTVKPSARWGLRLESGVLIELPGAVCVVGRKPRAGEGESAVVVPDATHTLSRSHAKFTRTGDDGWLVRDLGSANGVGVRGNDLVGAGEVPAGDGDVIRLGTLTCTLLRVT